MVSWVLQTSFVVSKKKKTQKKKYFLQKNFLQNMHKNIKPSGKLVRVLKAQQWPDTTRAHYLLYIKLIYNL